jgi:hypothetical protein
MYDVILSDDRIEGLGDPSARCNIRAIEHDLITSIRSRRIQGPGCPIVKDQSFSSATNNPACQ